MSNLKDKGKTYKFPEEYSELPNSKNIHVLRWLDQLVSKKKKERRLLVVTDWNFYLFKPKRFSSTLRIATKFRWLDITRLSCRTVDDVTIEFYNTDTIFETQSKSSNVPFITIFLKNSKMFLKFYQFIYSYSLESEYPIFNFPDELETQVNKVSKHDAISHINMRLRSNGLIMTKTVQGAIQRFLTKKSSKLKLNKFKILQESIPFFCECIDWFPFVTKIIVPFQAFTESEKTTTSTNANNDNSDLCTNQDYSDPICILQSFLPNSTYINEISFIGRAPYNFSALVNSIMANTKKIITVSFKKCDFDILQCRSIADWINIGMIEYLYLISSLSPIVVNSFVQNLQNNRGTELLKKFVIYEAPGIDVSSLISYLPLIRYVSLAYCDFEISEFFYAVNNMPTKSLIETAILSGNRNGRRIQPNQKYPPYLRELNLSDINWEPDSIKNIFITFMAHKPKRNPEKMIIANSKDSSDFDDGGFDDEKEDEDEESSEPLIKLDMSNAKMKDENWKEFFKYVQVMKPSQRLGTIRWKSNQLHKVFFLFLEKCPNLKSITFDGCFSSSDILLPLFVAYLSDTKQNILRFSCAGTTRRWLGPEGSKIIIQCLSSNRTIKHANLSNNRSGRQMFIDLAQILNINRFVESIQIDGNDVTTLITYKNFFTSLRERRKPLKVNWPEQEMNDMLHYGTANKKMVDQVKKIYDDVINGTFIAEIVNVKKNKKKQKKTEDDYSDYNYDYSSSLIEENEIQKPNADDVL